VTKISAIWVLDWWAQPLVLDSELGADQLAAIITAEQLAAIITAEQITESINQVIHHSIY
jgi:non-ribosomal peptide synthetase component F